MSNLSQYSFGYNPEQAMSTDPQVNYISESGVYEGKITKAMLCKGSEGSQAWGVEFSFESDEDGQANFLRLWNAKRDGNFTWIDKNNNHRPLPGLAICQSIMGLFGLKQMRPQANATGEIGFPDFFGKNIAFALQKVLYTKNDGTEGYKFDIVRAFEYRTLKTLTEKTNSKDAAVHKYEIKDKDDRTNQGQSQQSNNGYANQNLTNNTQGVEPDLPF